MLGSFPPYTLFCSTGPHHLYMYVHVLINNVLQTIFYDAQNISFNKILARTLHPCEKWRIVGQDFPYFYTFSLTSYGWQKRKKERRKTKWTFLWWDDSTVMDYLKEWKVMANFKVSFAIHKWSSLFCLNSFDWTVLQVLRVHSYTPRTDHHFRLLCSIPIIIQSVIAAQ